MIKINITINELETKELHTLLAKEVNIEVHEIRKNATSGEKIACDYLRKKLEIEKNIEIINECKNKENKEIVDLIKSILK